MSDTQPAPQRQTPLTPAVFHILLALADGEKHGYAIMKEVEEVTDGSVTMGPGTLYGSIKRMLRAELIAESGERDDDDARRRYYVLTAHGRHTLAAEAQRMTRALQLVAQKKALGGLAAKLGWR